MFPQKRLAHLGDLFPGKAAPSIDTANGGSAVELPRTLARIVAELKDVVRVTTGHDDPTIVTGGRQDSGAAIFANPRTMTWKVAFAIRDYLFSAARFSSARVPFRMPSIP